MPKRNSRRRTRKVTSASHVSDIAASEGAFAALQQPLGHLLFGPPPLCLHASLSPQAVMEGEDMEVFRAAPMWRPCALLYYDTKHLVPVRGRSMLWRRTKSRMLLGRIVYVWSCETN